MTKAADSSCIAMATLAYFASKKAYQVSKKLEYIIALEIMAGTQALDFIEDLKPSRVVRTVYNLVRRKVAEVNEDRHFYPDIEYIRGLIHEGEILKVVEEQVGELKF